MDIYRGASCATPPTKHALDSKTIEKVQAKIKRQIGIYMRAPTAIADDQHGYWRGKGSINFDIASVKAELTTTIKTINSGGVGLEVRPLVIPSTRHLRFFNVSAGDTFPASLCRRASTGFPAYG